LTKALKTGKKEVIFYTLSPKETPRGLFLPPVKLFWIAQRRNAPAGMKFREGHGAHFATFPGELLRECSMSAM